MEVNIVLCGAPRVGKSSLINAICQQRIAKNSVTLDSSTKHLTKYQVEYAQNDNLHQTIFWDLPGIESWNENDVRDHINKLITATKPLCMIFCASPGSFAKLEHVEWLVSECAKQKIFCALVCTNMWAGRSRKEVLNEFRDILQKIHPNIQPFEADKVIQFGNVGLCTMVNSEIYIDDDIGIRKDPSGVNELILSISKCLDQESRSTWLQVISENKSFWSQMTCEDSFKSNKIDQHYHDTESFLQPMEFNESSNSPVNDPSCLRYENPSIIPDSECKEIPINSSAELIEDDENSASSNEEISSTEKHSSTDSTSNIHEQLLQQCIDCMDPFS